jgi:hypothetical protein
VLAVLTAGLLLAGAAPARIPSAETHDASSAKTGAAMQQEGELGRRWAQARRMAAEQGFTRGVWIGWALAPRDSGVYDVRSNSDAEGTGGRESLRRLLARGGPSVVRMGDGPAAGQVALLFRLGGGGDAVPRVMKIRTPREPADLDDVPLVWLGSAPDAESLSLLRTLYAPAGPEVRREMAAAASLHGRGEPALEFVRTVLASDPSPEVRAEAVYWLQHQGTPGALDLMERTARGDASPKVREEAVTGLARTATPEAWRRLQKLAHDGPDAGVRQEAQDWIDREGPGSEGDRIQ